MYSLAYLSGAPRVSTRDDAEMIGPKNHVLGIISGFQENGWKVDRFIVGDRPGKITRPVNGKVEKTSK